jgi:CRISPR-associated protein Csd2
MKMSLSNKIDFALIFSVKNANPNGDPLNGNRPRVNYDGYGEVSDVCLKRKIRNRLLDMGESIFVQSDDKKKDDFRSLKERFDKNEELKKEKIRSDKAKIACMTWFDVRAFGQVFAFGKGDDDSSVSIGVRGPVTIQSAYSLEPVDVESIQIVKSVNGKTEKEDKKSSDTMGMKHRIDKGIYVTYGSINCQLAELTGFSKEDAEKLKEAMRTIFENDASSARPEGSMEVKKLIWWEHSSKGGQYSAAKVHRSLHELITDPKRILDEKLSGTFDEEALKSALSGLVPEIIDGV